MAKARAANPQAARDKQATWRAANLDSVKATTRAYYARRFFWGRAMKLRGPDRATTVELARMWRRQRGACALTGRRLDRSAQLDHVVAKARGGGDNIGNLRWVCAMVNTCKRQYSDSEWLDLCRDCMALGRDLDAV